MDFCAGYLSGAVGIVVGNPLDILKVRIQSSASPRVNDAAGSRKTSSLLKGVAAPILTYGALNALLFASYNRSLPLLAGNAAAPGLEAQQAPAYPYHAHFLSGILAGLATFVISTPTELVKCRAQLASGAGTSTSAHIAGAIVRRHGLRGLYHGGIVTALRDGIGYGFYFLAYEACKDAWAARLDASRRWDEQAKIVVCGGVAGVVTWASVFPLDVVKSRVQTQAAFLPNVSATRGGELGTVGEIAVSSESQALLATNLTANKGRPLGAWAVAAQAYRQEGWRVFVRGLGVCSARAFVVNAVQWSVYEVVMKAAAAAAAAGT